MQPREARAQDGLGHRRLGSPSKNICFFWRELRRGGADSFRAKRVQNRIVFPVAELNMFGTHVDVII